MELPEASFVPFLNWALGGSPLVSEKWVGGASAQKDFSGPIRLLLKGEHVWSWFPVLAMTCKAPVHREQEEAQTLLGHITRRELGDKAESVAFLSKHALWLSLDSRGEFHFRKCSC